jgi:ketosteroid isomerase-like protein
MTGVLDIERFDVPGRSAREQRNAAKAREIFVAFSRCDFGVLFANLAPGGQVEVVGLTPERLGDHAQNPNLIPELFTQGMCFRILDTIAEGDVVCVRWEDEAVTSTGKTYRNKGVTVFRFDDEGRVAQSTEYLDPNQFLEIL